MSNIVKTVALSGIVLLMAASLLLVAILNSKTSPPATMHKLATIKTQGGQVFVVCDWLDNQHVAIGLTSAGNAPPRKTVAYSLDTVTGRKEDLPGLAKVMDYAVKLGDGGSPVWGLTRTPDGIALRNYYGGAEITTADLAEPSIDIRAQWVTMNSRRLEYGLTTVTWLPDQSQIRMLYWDDHGAWISLGRKGRMFGKPIPIAVPISLKNAPQSYGDEIGRLHSGEAVFITRSTAARYKNGSALLFRLASGASKFSEPEAAGISWPNGSCCPAAVSPSGTKIAWVCRKEAFAENGPFLRKMKTWLSLNGLPPDPNDIALWLTDIHGQHPTIIAAWHDTQDIQSDLRWSPDGKVVTFINTIGTNGLNPSGESIVMAIPADERMPLQ